MAVRDHPLPLPSRAVPAWVLRVPGTTPRLLAAGAGLGDAGGPADGDLIVVAHGALALASAPPTGRTAALAILGPGDAFGPGPERPQVRPAAPGARRLDLRALVPSEIVRVPTTGLRLACARDPSVGLELALMVARQAEALSRRLELALTAHVVDRVHRTLGELAGAHGIRRRGGRGVEIGLPLSQDLIAALVGATRESVNRALRVLGERGQVARREGRYVLPGPS